jgi:hypothetical protein
VAFLVDATGSMADEIDAVKDRIREMVAQIAGGSPTPDVRFGIVAYRDRGDEYVTRVYPLTREIDGIVADLETVRADGGGDYPESLLEALHTTVHGLDWDLSPQVARLVFLLADAPPHLDYVDDFDLVEEYQMAAERGIVVHALGASGLDEEGERIFRTIAAATGGQFNWLAYESRYVAEDGEAVTVLVEGRTTTYTKGDSTWTVEGGGGGWYGGGPLTGDVALSEDGAVRGGGAVPAASAGEVTTTTNLADLITDAVRDAAESRGVDYGGSTSAPQASWATVKRDGR